MHQSSRRAGSPARQREYGNAQDAGRPSSHPSNIRMPPPGTDWDSRRRLLLPSTEGVRRGEAVRLVSSSIHLACIVLGSRLYTEIFLWMEGGLVREVSQP